MASYSLVIFAQVCTNFRTIAQIPFSQVTSQISPHLVLLLLTFVRIPPYMLCIDSGIVFSYILHLFVLAQFLVSQSDYSNARVGLNPGSTVLPYSLSILILSPYVLKFLLEIKTHAFFHVEYKNILKSPDNSMTFLLLNKMLPSLFCMFALY